MTTTEPPKFLRCWRCGDNAAVFILVEYDRETDCDTIIVDGGVDCPECARTVCNPCLPYWKCRFERDCPIMPPLFPFE